MMVMLPSPEALFCNQNYTFTDRGRHQAKALLVPTITSALKTSCHHLYTQHRLRSLLIIYLFSICLLFRQWPVDCGRCRKWSQFANFFLQKLSSHPQQISGLIVVWGCGLWRGASFIVILLRQKQSRKNWPPEKYWSHLTSSAASSSRPQFLYCLGHNDKNILIFQ